VRRARWDGLEIVEEMFSTDSRWNLEMMRVEEENIARSIGAFLYREMDERQHYLPLNTATPTKDKDKRSKSMQARCRAGRVRVDKDAEWYPDFEEELTRYPKYPYKDQFDAFGWLGLMLEEMVDPPTQEEFEDEEYLSMIEHDAHDGRDAYTGY